MKSEIVAVIRGSVVSKSSSSISEVKAYQRPNRLKPKGGPEWEAYARIWL